MGIINEEKVFIRGIMSSVLKIAKSAISMYEKTGDERFLAHGEHFIEFHRKLKTRI